jgi:hypothetical protein
MESTNSSEIYIGYSKHEQYIWTIEFKLDNPPENYDMIFSVSKFLLKSIEDKDGKFLRKIPKFAINSEYYLRKHPIKVYLKRDNLDFVNFYNFNREKYNTFTGQVNEYFSCGTLFLSYYLINGKLNGNFVNYYKKYDIYEQSYFIDGLRHGKCFIHNYSGFDIWCDFNMGNIISYDIKIIKSTIFDIYESYCYTNNNFIENGIVNIDNDDYIGNIVLENGKIISNTIEIKEKKALNLIKKNFSEIPKVITGIRLYDNTSYV